MTKENPKRNKDSLSPRERLIRSLRHEPVDQVPADLGGIVTGITKRAYQKLIHYLGLEEDPPVFDRKQQLVIPSEEVLQILKIDTRYLFPGPRDEWKCEIREEEQGFSYVDEWGIEMFMPRDQGLYFDMVKHPLAHSSKEDLDKYPWPAPDDPGLTRGLRERARWLYENTDYALVAWGNASIFERAWYLRGFMQFFSDLILNPDFACALMDKLLEWNLSFLDHYLGAIGDWIQVLQLSDDLGHQEGLLLSPEMYRKYIKPRQAELIRFIRKRTNAFIFYHTCGAVFELIPDLIEIGVDVLNPVQVSAKGMDPVRLKKEFGNKIAFWGGIDTQSLLPYATPEEVRRQTRIRILQLGRNSGYVLNPVHNIQADVPPENILALFHTPRNID